MQTEYVRTGHRRRIISNISPKRNVCVESAAEPAPPGRLRCPPCGGDAQRRGGGLVQPGRFIWQLVGVLDT